MTTSPQLSLKPRLSRLFSHSGFWIWATIVLSIIITGSIGWLRFRQVQIIWLATTQLETVRLARIDLSKGFLYTTLSGEPGSPFNQDEGLALINQAIISLDRTLVDLGPPAEESTGAFHQSADAFRDALTEWTQATTSRPEKAASLRIAFRELEHQAGRVDTQVQQNLNDLSNRLESEFVVALSVSAVMLAGICGILYLAGRARSESEAALLESEERYRSITETLTDYIYTVRVEDGRVIDTTHGLACVAVTGYSCEDFAANPDLWLQMVDEADRPAVLEQARRLLDDGVAQPIEHRITRKDGMKRWVRNTPVPHYDPSGKLLSYDGLIQDITERKQAEKALQESEARYRSLIENQSEVIARSDLEGHLTVVNDAYCRAFGKSREELIGYIFAPTVLPEDVSISLAVLQAVQSPPYRIQSVTRHFTPLGIRWFEWENSAILDENETVIELQGVGRDITERRRVEEALRASEENYRLLFMHNPAPMWVYDVGSLAFLAVNDFAVDHYGYSRSEFLNMTIRDIRPAEDIPYLHEVLHKHTGKIRKVGVARHRKKDDSLIEVEITAHETEFEGREAMLVLALDVTERRKAEQELSLYRNHLEELVAQRTVELKEANDQLLILSRAKDEFVSNVSHELRTPISSLKLRQHLLENHPDHLDEHFKVIKRETERLARTIEDLLQLSRLDQGRVDLSPVSLDLNELVSQYVTDRLPLAADKGLTLHFRSESGLPKPVVDAGLLGQAFSILLTNAISYTPTDGQVFVRTHVKEQAGKQWIGLSVNDTGPGIPSDEQPQLFERFFRGRAGRKSGVPGTGLGLAIAQEIISRHGGNIEVESDGVPGHGALFKMWIPIEEVSDDKPAGS